MMIFHKFRALGSLVLFCLFSTPLLANTPSLSIVDVMILFTPKRAESVLAGGTSLQDYAINMVTQANEVYDANGVHLNLRLVHVDQLDRENADIEGGITGLMDLPQVKSLREAYRADIVSLMIYVEESTSAIADAHAESFGAEQTVSANAQPLHCSGTGLIPNDLERTGKVSRKMAFSMINQLCNVNPPLNFMHELGHNMGLAHARVMDHEQNRSPRALEYGYGYGVRNFFSTIMGYPDVFFAPRIPQFSNPAVICPGNFPCGVPQGEPDSADAVAALNVTAPYVAGFYNSLDGVSVGPKVVRDSGTGNLLKNPGFDYQWNPDTFEFDITDWGPINAILAPSSILDIDIDTNELDVFGREGEGAGFSQLLNPAIIRAHRNYRVSALMLLPNGKGAGPVDKGIIRLEIRTQSPANVYSYEVQGEITDTRHKKVAGKFHIGALTGQVTEARITYTVSDPAVDFSLVRPYFGLW